jgi:hypothetical protein
MYKIVRHYLGPIVDGHHQSFTRTIVKGLSLEEAQQHCQSPETSSRTAKSAIARRRTREHGPWFDGYQET